MARKSLDEDMVQRKLEISERLELIRKKMNMNKTSFCEFLGISTQYYSTLCKGENFLGLDKLINFAIKTDTSLDYLILGKTSSNDEINYILNNLSSNESAEMVRIMKAMYILLNKDQNINNIDNLGNITQLSSF